MFDPLQLWERPEDKKLFVLSGHSRLAFAKKMASTGETVGGRGFENLPAKIYRGISLGLAKEIAAKSNVRGTAESIQERAAFYRKKKEAGTPDAEIQRQARTFEGTNAKKIDEEADGYSPYSSVAEGGAPAPQKGKKRA